MTNTLRPPMEKGDTIQVQMHKVQKRDKLRKYHRKQQKQKYYNRNEKCL